MRRSRSVDIFNFSFLDVLACTIGLLIFIMVMVFILQTGGSVLADVTVVVQRRAQTRAELIHAAKNDEQLAEGLEQTLRTMPLAGPSALPAQRDRAVQVRDQAKAKFTVGQNALSEAEQDLQQARQLRTDRDRALADARREVDAAKAQRDQAASELEESKRKATPILKLEGAQGDAKDYSVLHVDCQADQCVIVKTDPQGHPIVVARVSSRTLAAADGAYQRAIATHNREDHPLVLFWVRADGIETFELAQSLLPAGMSHGYEPADASLKLDSMGK